MGLVPERDSSAQQDGRPRQPLPGECLRRLDVPRRLQLRKTVDELRQGFAMRRLIRRGIPIRTPTYEVGEHMIWGATARILSDFLDRLETER